jgi:hypothetical protein
MSLQESEDTKNAVVSSSGNGNAEFVSFIIKEVNKCCE